MSHALTLASSVARSLDGGDISQDCRAMLGWLACRVCHPEVREMGGTGRGGGAICYKMRGKGGERGNMLQQAGKWAGEGGGRGGGQGGHLQGEVGRRRRSGLGERSYGGMRWEEREKGLQPNWGRRTKSGVGKGKSVARGQKGKVWIGTSMGWTRGGSHGVCRPKVGWMLVWRQRCVGLEILPHPY